MVPLVLIGFCTAIGALCGSWLVGLCIGLGIVIALTILNACVEADRKCNR